LISTGEKNSNKSDFGEWHLRVFQQQMPLFSNKQTFLNVSCRFQFSGEIFILSGLGILVYQEKEDELYQYLLKGSLAKSFAKKMQKCICNLHHLSTAHFLPREGHSSQGIHPIFAGEQKIVGNSRKNALALSCSFIFFSSFTLHLCKLFFHKRAAKSAGTKGEEEKIE
jgi:hypothetical protein